MSIPLVQRVQSMLVAEVPTSTVAQGSNRPGALADSTPQAPAIPIRISTQIFEEPKNSIEKIIFKPANEHPQIGRVIVHQWGEYKDRVFMGGIIGYMPIPNEAKAIALWTGTNAKLFDQLPDTEEVRSRILGNGHTHLQYVLDTGPIVSRDIGNSVESWVEKDGENFTVHFRQAHVQLEKNGEGSALSCFDVNSGSWEAILEPGYNPPVYKVTFQVHTVSNEDAMPFGSSLVPDSIITNETKDRLAKSYREAAALLRSN